MAKEDTWTVQDSEELYRVKLWGESYFCINAEGHLEVRPVLGDPIGIDLLKVVEDLRQQKIAFPLLIRFQDLLRSRVAEINTAFRKAIDEAGYQNSYISVYPIKVNQLHEVVEEVLAAGRPFGLGLECGSKAELVAALPHLTDDEALLVCNGVKDASMLRLILDAQLRGRNVVPVVEKFAEFELLMRLGGHLQIVTADTVKAEHRQPSAPMRILDIRNQLRPRHSLRKEHAGRVERIDRASAARTGAPNVFHEP